MKFDYAIKALKNEIRRTEMLISGKLPISAREIFKEYITELEAAIKVLEAEQSK